MPDHSIYFVYAGKSEELVQECREEIMAGFEHPPAHSDSEVRRVGRAVVECGDLRANVVSGHPDQGYGSFTFTDNPHVFIGASKSWLETSFEREEIQSRSPEYIERVNELVEMVKVSYEALSTKPDVVYGLPRVNCRSMAEGDYPLPATAATLSEDRINYVPWLMIFPPGLVDTYGKEFLLDSPAWQVEELPDGSVLLVAFEDLVDCRDRDTWVINDRLGLEDPFDEQDEQSDPALNTPGFVVSSLLLDGLGVDIYSKEDYIDSYRFPFTELSVADSIGVLQFDHELDLETFAAHAEGEIDYDPEKIPPLAFSPPDAPETYYFLEAGVGIVLDPFEDEIVAEFAEALPGYVPDDVRASLFPGGAPTPTVGSVRDFDPE
jgi:hypothetical protein